MFPSSIFPASIFPPSIFFREGGPGANTYTAASFNIALGLVGADLLVLGGQHLIGRPSILFGQAFPNGRSVFNWAVDDYYIDYQKTLAPSASKTYIISNILDSINRRNPLIDIKVFCVVVTARTAGDHLTWGPGVTNGWATPLLESGTQEIFDLMLHIAGATDNWPVTSGVADQVTVRNVGTNPITYDLLLIGNTE